MTLRAIQYLTKLLGEDFPVSELPWAWRVYTSRR